ncbi:MAG: exodeoxyribonuclease VII small subunit [Thermoguttaceae bacterium]|nr:exodeoxyribonuclease VII small subunit [Planctomycetaceae bacterium]MBQ4143255.1 exodeoxyribonuclease VII small subunit [Thermoguttaceae bacterium]
MAKSKNQTEEKKQNAAELSKDAANGLTFEDAFGRLQEVVRTLENGQAPLDDSLKLYEEGVRLIRQCHEKLTGARRRIEIIAGTNENGKPVLRQMDEEERSLEERSQTHGR